MSTNERRNRLFGDKHVLILACRHCSHTLSHRGMQALLLADTRTHLYSADTQPAAGAALVGAEYTTRACACRISDTACLMCGNVVGYHVTRPCVSCLSSCNNGHLWIFHGNAARAVEREDSTRLSHMVWADIPPMWEDSLPQKQMCGGAGTREEDSTPRKRSLAVAHECLR